MQGNSPDEEHEDPHGRCAARIHDLEAALTEMAGTYYYHPRLLEKCNEILRRVGLPDFVKPTQASEGS